MFGPRSKREAVQNASSLEQSTRVVPHLLLVPKRVEGRNGSNWSKAKRSRLFYQFNIFFKI